MVLGFSLIVALLVHPCVAVITAEAAKACCVKSATALCVIFCMASLAAAYIFLFGGGEEEDEDPFAEFDPDQHAIDVRGPNPYGDATETEAPDNSTRLLMVATKAATKVVLSHFRGAAL